MAEVISATTAKQKPAGNDFLYNTFIFCLSAMGVMGLSFVMPILPDIERTFDISSTRATMIISVYTLPGIVISLFCGILAELLGRRFLVFLGIIFFTIGGILCIEAKTFDELLAFRALQGIGGGMAAALYAVLLADRYTGEYLTTMMGRVSFAIGLNTALLPLLGGYLGEIAWNTPFYTSLFGIVLLILFPFIDFEKKTSNFSIINYFKTSAKAVQNTRIILLFLLIFLGFMIYYGFISFLPTIMSTNFGLSSSKIGIFLFIAATGASFSSFFLGALAKRYTLTALLLWSGTFYLLSQMLSFIDINIYFYCIPLFLAGIAQGLCAPIVNKEIANASPENHSTLLPLSAAIFRTGQTLTPFLYGFAWSLYSWHGVFYAGIILASAFILISLGYNSIKKN